MIHYWDHGLGRLLAAAAVSENTIKRRRTDFNQNFKLNFNRDTAVLCGGQWVGFLNDVEHIADDGHCGSYGILVR